MIDNDEFREWGHKFVDWVADYYQTVDQYPVKSKARPGEILGSIPAKLPETSESMERIWSDFRKNIMPGMTHWQHPGFMAYFPANTSFPSILAEMLTAGLGAQCMIWDTSPAAAELEERMMQWLGQLLGIPASWPGTIQATASEATLSAILSARERVTDFTVNARGLQGHPHLRVYASKQIHSSIEKAVKIAGLGKENFVAIPTDSDYAMDVEQLEGAILRDKKEGNIPTCIIVGLGTTGSTAIDPLKKIVALAREHKIWVHVDAAYAGTALMLREHRHLLEGIEEADSFVVNPHKWMMVNFDCSCYFVKDKGVLIRTFEILPEYLKTDADQQVNNYRDWGIPLGRRFRALKLWFVMRNFGADQIRQTIRNHITWAQEIATKIRSQNEFELLAPVPFNLICFRFAPSGMSLQELNKLNKAIVERIKSSGTLYLTHTILSGRYTIRLVAGQTYLKQEDLQRAWGLHQENSQRSLSGNPLLMTTRSITLLMIALLSLSSLSAQEIRVDQITIIRDSFGVAHIHAPTDAEAAYGFAWAQAEDDFETMQLTLLPIRGRMAEYSGKSGAILDVAAAMIGVDSIVEQRYDRELSPEFRKIAEAFAAGITAYAEAHPEELLVKKLGPFTGKDIIKGYVFETAFLTGLQQPLEDVFGNRLEILDLGGPTGSNAWAFSPSITEDGMTYFCSNSHQPLQSSFSWYEAHIVSDEGWNVLGATFPGGITPFVGTNPFLGWTHTVNHPDFVDIYQLEMHPTEKLMYKVDGQWKTLKEQQVKLKVKLAGGIKLPVKQRFYQSIYGLTIENDQGFFSIRFAANQAIGASEQWYLMNKATNWEEFRVALDRTDIPGTNIVYADREGNIFHVGNARMPVRAEGFNWSGVLPGNTTETLWNEFYDFDNLPQVLNPDCGWVFNSNHTAFASSGPFDAPLPSKFPESMGYPMTQNNRSLRFFELLESTGDKVSWEEFLDIKYDLVYNDSLYDPIIENWDDLYGISANQYPDLEETLEILNAWDKSTAPDREGATIFLLCWNSMYQRLQPQGKWKSGYEASESELVAALRDARDHLAHHFGNLHVPLGAFQRHRRGKVDLPVGGGPNILAALYARETENGRFESAVGDGFIQFVKYDNQGPVLIETVMPYGASAKPDSPHYTDQMSLYVNQQRKVMSLDLNQARAQAEKIYHPGQ